MAQKKFEELDLSNAFLFAAALEDEETCRLILELILGRPIPKVNVHVEHSLLFSADFRSIRLDVYASDETQVGYNLEMQNEDKKKLPKRSRFHQAEIDVGALKPGDDFEALQPSYIIFICTFDPFEDNLYRYTFEYRCLERDFPLGDETCRIFLSTKGTNDNEYVEHIDDELIRQLHKKISKLKESRKWREQYMTFEELLRNSENKGHKEGLAEGRNRTLELTIRMIESGEADSVSRLKNDSEFLEQMYEKYHV